MYKHSCIVLTALRSISRKEMKRGEIQLPKGHFCEMPEPPWEGNGLSFPIILLIFGNLLFSAYCVLFFFSESMGRDILRGLLEDRVLNQEKMKIEGDGNDTEIDLA